MFPRSRCEPQPVKPYTMKTMLAVIRDLHGAGHFISYVSDLAADLSAGLHLLYVENPANYPLGAPEMSGVAVANLQKSLEVKVTEAREKIGRLVKDMGSGISEDLFIEISSRVGNEASLIQEMAENQQVHMVAVEYKQMATFWGTNSYVKHLLRNLTCPVWVIPEGSEYSGLKHILYATDYHQEDISTLKRLIGFTRSLSPEVDALHITDRVDFDERVRKEGFKQMLESKTGYQKISLKVLLEGNGHDMYDLLKGYASRTQADLIVVLKENKNFLERLFSPSASEKMVDETELPVLVFHERADD
jgi:nucleotide-binding universal stress UspA family protein